MTAPEPAPSVGRYVRAVVGSLAVAGAVAIGILEVLRISAAPDWQSVALPVVLFVGGWLMVDPSAIGELVSAVKAWKGQ